MSKKLLLFSLISSFILILILSIPFTKRVYPNIYIANIYVGDKSKAEAINYIKDKTKIPNKLILNTNGIKSEIFVSEIIKNINYDKTIERAYNYAHTGNVFNDSVLILKLIFQPVNLPLDITFDEDKLLETILITTNSSNSNPVAPSAKKVNDEVVINEGKDGTKIDILKARQNIGYNIATDNPKDIDINLEKIKSKLSSEDILKYKLNAEKLIGKNIDLKFESNNFTIDDSELISFLTPSGFSDDLIKEKILKISRQLNRSPQNSVFVIENGKAVEFTPSKDGVVVDEDSLLNQIKELPAEINIPVIKTSPKIKNEDVNNLGIKTLLGVGKSNFRGSIQNRIYNVNLAQSKFRGLLVPPNEVVSFNNVLGDVSAFTGYKSAYVIKDGKTVLGDGGGVCQVSTTLFRAVLNAGLPILERRAHAYRVGYYEQGFAPGLDATVYSPTTDFKFKNDTETYILIQPTINLEALTLEFEIYGTSDGRISTISKPIVTNSIAPADDLYQDDPTLKVGVVKQIEHRAYGAKVIFNYKVTRNGEELINQKFVSNYRPWQAVYLRGTAQ